MLSGAFKFFMVFFTWIPGILAIYYMKKEKMALPVLKSSGKILFVIYLAISTVVLAFLFSMPFCLIRSVASMKALFPFFQYSYGAESGFSSILLASQILLMLVMSLAYYVFASMGHELMFRGYAWEKLKFLGFWKASWLIGLIFSVWFVPMFLIGVEYPGTHLKSVVIQILICVLVSPIMVYLRVVSKGLLVPVLYIGIVKSLSNLFPFLFQSADYFYINLQGFAAIFSLLLINLILFLKTRKTPFLEYEL